MALFRELLTRDSTAFRSAQAFSFGRAFAAYGSVFILTAMLWGWWVDGQPPDRWDWLGVTICLIGVAIILGTPRS